MAKRKRTTVYEYTYINKDSEIYQCHKHDEGCGGGVTCETKEIAIESGLLRNFSIAAESRW